MTQIPDSEYEDRIIRLQNAVRQNGLDGVLLHSNEAEFTNVRYLSDYWPVFETAGVFLPAFGEPCLIIGPESLSFAKDRSRIRNIEMLLCYRESAEPDYPGIPVKTFDQIFSRYSTREVRKLGVIGFSLMPVTIYTELKESRHDLILVRADDLLTNLRVIKSENEIKCLEKAFEIAEIAIDRILENMKPGMTELQIVGIAQQVIYSLGAENEGMPQYVQSGKNSIHAVYRASSKEIVQGEMIQLNISSRVNGYSSGVGRPVCFGKMSQEMRHLALFGLEAHYKTMDLMTAGKPAKQVAIEYFEWVKKCGHEKHLLYGPAHGLGMLEVERPWLEISSEYDLQENMTFQIDTFFYTNCFGLRWENGARITKGKPTMFSGRNMGILEL